MSLSIAILVGNVKYEHLHDLECCGNDLDAMKDLLTATEKYESVNVIRDSDSTQLKDQLLELLPKSKDYKEIFLYFSGHGFASGEDFFYCPTDFRGEARNQTGLSNTQLFELLRPLGAHLIVRLVDACNAGSRLFKSTESFFNPNGKGLNNLIQIAACMESEEASTGPVLSPFTEQFRNGTLQKQAGPIRYSEIRSYLCDQYLSSEAQTPYFSGQETGRETFVDDAKLLDRIRASILESVQTDEAVDLEGDVVEKPVLSLPEKLESIESAYGDKEIANQFIDKILVAVDLAIEKQFPYGDLFEIEKSASTNYYDNPDESYVVTTLLKQDRTDRLVSASSHTYSKRKSPLFIDPFSAKEIVTEHDLTLNCSLDVAQVKIDLSPKFLALSKVSMQLTFAPSLERCYIFLSIGSTRLTDWNGGSYEPERRDVKRMWFQPTWHEETDGIAKNVMELLADYSDRAISTFAD